MTGMFDVAGKGASGGRSGSGNSPDRIRQKQSEDASGASEFHGGMHKQAFPVLPDADHTRGSCDRCGDSPAGVPPDRLPFCPLPGGEIRKK